MRNLRAVRGECGAVDHIGPRRTAHATRTPHWPTPLALSPLHAYAQALRICVWGHHVTTLYFSRVNTKVSASSSGPPPASRCAVPRTKTLSHERPHARLCSGSALAFSVPQSRAAEVGSAAA